MILNHDLTNELQVRFANLVLDGLGASVRPAELNPCGSVKEFVDHYGLRIDRQPFDWDRYSYAVDAYECDHQWVVLQAAAQTMKTAFMMSWFLHKLVLEWGCMAGVYFPNNDMAGQFSNVRFAPFVRGNRVLARHFGADIAGDMKGQDAVHTRTFGPSTARFLSAVGRASTESMPLRVVMLDEVRRMSIGDVERIEKRMAAQARPWFVAGSTASYADGAIGKLFAETDQQFFHTACKTDVDGVALSLEFPACIVDMRKITPLLRNKIEHAFERAGVPNLGVPDHDIGKWPDACYQHPRTGEILPLPSRGFWEPHGSSTWKRGYQISQMHSWNHPAGRILAEFERSRDTAEFYWSVLGLSYTDDSKIPVKQEHLEACVNERLVWAATQSHEWRTKWVRATAMGVDVQDGYLIAVIKEKARNGNHRTVHVEVVHDGPPGALEGNGWIRLGQLINGFAVKRTVIDRAPLFEPARHFAKSFPGKVFLARYSDDRELGEELCRWNDAKAPNDQRGREQRFRWSVAINRTRALAWALGRWARGLNETPHPGRLQQMLPVVNGKAVLSAELREGQWEPRPICRDLYWPHQRGIIFRDTFEGDDERALDAARLGKTRIMAEHIGASPDFAHANMFADLALDSIPVSPSEWEG